MLTSLNIRNLLIIEELSLDFQAGLNVLTGETGAGKSILLDALGAVLGWRGRADLVREGAEQGDVTAVFHLSDDHPARAVLAESGIDVEDGELVLRRVVTTAGRKSAFVNDRRTSGELLRQLSDLLVELHGQHDDRGLLNPRGHRSLLDAVKEGDSWARLEPHDGYQVTFGIEFENTIIGHQEMSLDMANGTFVRELCDSRTFCRYDDVEMMREQGLALGGTFSNALVVDGDRYLTPGGPRRHDEAVRHKILDAIGDLALAGAPLVGRFVAHRGGHALTNRLLRKAFCQPGAMRLVELSDAQALRLPGFGTSHADMPAVA